MNSVIHIGGMSCGRCKARVEQAVGSLPGVESVEVSLESKSAAVAFNDAVVSLEIIEEKIEALGFEIAR